MVSRRSRHLLTSIDCAFVSSRTKNPPVPVLWSWSPFIPPTVALEKFEFKINIVMMGVRFVWILLLTSLLQQALAVPLSPDDIQEEHDSNGRLLRWHASETPKGVPGIDGKGGRTLDNKSKEFHDMVRQLQEGKTSPWQKEARPATAYYNQEENKIHYSTTTRGGKGPDNQAYRDTAEAHKEQKGIDCWHKSGGKCGETGATKDSGSKVGKGDQISTYGEIAETDPKTGKATVDNNNNIVKTEKHHQGCGVQEHETNKFGCRDVLAHKKVQDLHHPNQGQQDARIHSTPGLVKDRVKQLDPKNGPASGSPPPPGSPGHEHPTSSDKAGNSKEAGDSKKSGSSKKPDSGKTPGGPPPPRPEKHETKPFTAGNKLGHWKPTGKPTPPPRHWEIGKTKEKGSSGFFGKSGSSVFGKSGSGMFGKSSSGSSKTSKVSSTGKSLLGKIGKLFKRSLRHKTMARDDAIRRHLSNLQAQTLREGWRIA